MIRCLDENFVDVLKERMEADPSSPGVPPLAVLCTDHKVCENNMHNIPNFYDPYSGYTWRVLNFILLKIEYFFVVYKQYSIEIADSAIFNSL